LKGEDDSLELADSSNLVRECDRLLAGVQKRNGFPATTPITPVATSAAKLHLRLFRHLQGVVYLDSKVPYGAFKLGVAKQ